jgi:lactate permease
MSGKLGEVFARTFWHSIVLTLLLGGLVAVQQYLIPWVIPKVMRLFSVRREPSQAAHHG